MELAIAPPSRVTAGVTLSQPVVVTFATLDRDKEPNGATFTIPETNGFWAFVSLTTADMQQTLDPPRSDLLRGRRTDSIHPIHQEQEGDKVTVAYATFSELMITQPGQYRLRVNIIDMNIRFGRASGPVAGTILPSLYSEIIDVVEEEEHVINDAQTAAIRDRLRSIGVDC